MKYDIANKIPLLVGAGVASCLFHLPTGTDVHDEGCVPRITAAISLQGMCKCCGQGKRHIHMNYMYCLCPFKQKVKEDNKGNPPKIVQKDILLQVNRRSLSIS